MEKWFVCHNDIVSGPYTKDQINQKMVEGELPPDILVWGKSLNVWKPFEWWASNYENIIENAKTIADPRQWHFTFQGETQGPLNRKDLVEELRKLNGDANDALIWTKGMTNWAPIFEFHDIMDEVGVNRRQFPRAPVKGKIVLHHGDQYIVGEMSMVSQGGFGARNFAYDFAPGLQLKMELISEDLGGTIYAQAQVRYIDESTVGFQFININRESQALIITYVKEKNNQILSEIKDAA